MVITPTLPVPPVRGTVMRVAAERGVDRAGHVEERTPDERQIFALQRTGAAVVGEGVGEAFMRLVGLGDHQQT